MESIERELNAYLFLEFGMEEDETSISETWAVQPTPAWRDRS